MKRLALLALSLALICTGVHANNVPISQLPPGGNMLPGDLVPATRTGITYGVVFNGTALSSLTAASVANTISNGNYTQFWDWNTLGSNTGLSILGLTSSNGVALSVTTSGAGNSGYAGYFANTATTGYAAFMSGNLGVSGATALGGNLSVMGSTYLSGATTAASLVLTGNLTGTNAALAGTTTLGALEVTGNSYLGSTTTVGGSLNVIGNLAGVNASLSGTTTVVNLSITGTCTGCGGSIASQTIISSGSTHTTSACNTFVGWNSASGSPKTENIPSSTGSLCEITITDLFGDAGTNAITPVPATGSILGSPTVYTSHGSITLVDTSAGWTGI